MLLGRTSIPLFSSKRVSLTRSRTSGTLFTNIAIVFPENRANSESNVRIPLSNGDFYGNNELNVRRKQADMHALRCAGLKSFNCFRVIHTGFFSHGHRSSIMYTSRRSLSYKDQYLLEEARFNLKRGGFCCLDKFRIW